MAWPPLLTRELRMTAHDLPRDSLDRLRPLSEIIAETKLPEPSEPAMTNRGPRSASLHKKSKSSSRFPADLDHAEYPNLTSFLTKIPANHEVPTTGTISIFMGKHSLCVCLRDRAFRTRLFVPECPSGPLFWKHLEQAISNPEANWEHDAGAPQSPPNASKSPK